MKFFKRLVRSFSRPVEARLEHLIRSDRVRPASVTGLTSCARHPAVELFRDAGRDIRHVRIGGWRVIAASKARRIAEVLPLICGRVAVRVDREDPKNRELLGTTWELYDLQGHLLSMLQTLPGEEFWLATDFETGRVAHSPIPQELYLSA